MIHRDATLEELVAYYQPSVASKRRVRFRHFTKEIYAPLARNGVRHQQYSLGVLIYQDGKVLVRHHGELVELTSSAAVLDNGKVVLYDLRIKSEYLK